MPDPRFAKPWHGVPRENIEWQPTVDEAACIGCGTCVTGCSRLVYRFDYDRKKAVVVDPLNCMVGCTTCANTCPTHAIHFPPLATVFALEGRPQVRHAIEDDLIARHDQLALSQLLPHPERIIELSVDGLYRPTPHLLQLRLSPMIKGECFCQFAPGQYVEVFIPDSPYLSRAYSISNPPREDGGIDLQIRRVEGGRLSEWAFNKTKQGDRLRVRGPLGSFTMRSPIDRPLLLVAGGSGFAPVEALIAQQLELDRERDMVLIWGAEDARDFYAIDVLREWTLSARNLRILLAAKRSLDAFPIPVGIVTVTGDVIDALHAQNLVLAGRDAYLAGPPGMLDAVIRELRDAGVQNEAIHVAAFGMN